MNKIKSSVLDVMISVVRREGSILVREHNRILLLQGSNSLLEYCKKAKSRLFSAIQKTLNRFFPHIQCVSDCSIEDGFVFMLDNELGFMRGGEDFIVILNFFIARSLVATAWYVPVYDRIFWAEKGKGAFADNVKLRKSNFVSSNPIYFLDSSLFKANTSLTKECSDSAILHVCNVSNLHLARYARGCYDVVFVAACNYDNLFPGVFLLREAGIFPHMSDKKGYIAYKK